MAVVEGTQLNDELTNLFVLCLGLGQAGDFTDWRRVVADQATGVEPGEIIDLDLTKHELGHTVLAFARGTLLEGDLGGVHLGGMPALIYLLDAVA